MSSRVSRKVYWYGPEHHTMLSCKCSTSGCVGLGILWAKAKTGRKFLTQLRSLLTFSQDRCTKALEVVSVQWQNVEIDCDHLNNTKASGQYYSLGSMKQPRVLSYLPLHLPSRDEMIDHPRTHPKILSGLPNNSLVPISTPGWKEAPWEERIQFKYTTRHELWKRNSSLMAYVSYDKLANYARNV